jgi:hypothetical protein
MHSEECEELVRGFNAIRLCCVLSGLCCVLSGRICLRYGDLLRLEAICTLFCLYLATPQGFFASAAYLSWFAATKKMGRYVHPVDQYISISQ